MKSKIASALIVLCLGISNLSHAEEQPWKEVGFFVQTTTTRMMQYVGKTNVEAGQDDWKFSAVWLRVQAQFGIQIPWLAALRVVPEVEIVLEEN